MSTDTLKDAGNSLGEQASAAMGDIRTRAKSAADTASSMADKAKPILDDAAKRARDAAAKAQSQAKDIAGDLYDRGEEVASQTGQWVQQQPLVALLAAGAIGFAIGYLVSGRG